MKKRPLVLLCLLFVLFIRCFYVWFAPALPDHQDLDGREVYIKGQVVSVQEQNFEYHSQIMYTLSNVTIYKNSAGTALSYSEEESVFVLDTKEKVVCYMTEEAEGVSVGSDVVFQGRVACYDTASNPGEFDSRFYYAVQGIEMKVTHTTVVWCSEKPDILRYGCYRVKTYLSDKLSRCFSEKYAGVMQTLLLGEKQNLDTQLKQFFKEGGILHIFSISGMHISMLGMGVFRLLRKLGVSIKKSAVFGAVVIAGYGMVIGVQTAMFRAMCMFFLRMAACYIGRTYDSMTAISVAAMLLLLEEPRYLYYSGFLLSFGAAVGACVAAPVLEAWCKKQGKLWKICGNLFAAQIGILAMTFPIQLFFFYEYPLYSTIINLILLPLLPYVVGIGIIVLVLPFGVWSGLAAWCCERLLFVYELVCVKSQSLPFHSLVLGRPDTWQILLYYVSFGLFLWCLKQKEKEKRLLQGMTGLFLVSFGMLCVLRDTSGLACDFLHVGQGDCAVLRYKDQTYVIDCGSSNQTNVGTDILLPYLKYYGRSNVNGIFLSHADADHINGIVQWLEAYEHSHVTIQYLLLPALSEQKQVEEFGELLDLAEACSIKVITLSAGDSLQLGDLQVQVLHPKSGCSDTKDCNAYSQVLLFRYAGTGILMTGDIGSEQEFPLCETLYTYQEEIAILKAAHHGSAYSNSNAFLEASMPEHIILSYGKDNRYGHPSTEATERMEAIHAKLWKTAVQGAIQCRITKKGIVIKTYKNEALR